eukprot:6214092-Pleurochrysis_carterae.AAC.2
MCLDAFVSSACSTSLGKVSEAGERVLWNDNNGTPSGRALVFYVPPSGQSFDKRRVQRVVSVVTVQCEQIVDVTSHGQRMHYAVYVSNGNSDRCQRRPACAMPYTGFSIRHTRGLPSAPIVAYPGGAWQYTTSSRSRSPCRYAATKSQRRICMLSELAMAESARKDVGRIVAQKVWSKSIP